MAASSSSSDDDDEVEEVEKAKAKEKKKEFKGGNKKNKKKNTNRKGEVGESELDLDSVIKDSTLLDSGMDTAFSFKEEKITSTIKVEAKFLNEAHELKLQFGHVVIEEEKREKNSAKRGARGKGQTAFSARKLLLVTPDISWGKPPTKVSGGLGMALKDGHFEYEYSDIYEHIQVQYEVCVQSYDPNQISQLLRFHPYHVDSMIQLSEILQATGQMEQAAQLVQRALFVLESAWHPSFNVVGGFCKLPFSVKANKALFKALFSHMRNAGRKGCMKTAFNIAKFLLSLDTSDPLGVGKFFSFYLFIYGIFTTC
jgi:hypothetical protein